jgi:tetratricopeptide (TPR) repeat protein
MPSKRLSRKPDDLSEHASQANEVYRRLLSFLELASGFSLAVAVCDDPGVRDDLILRAVSDAKKFGLVVHRTDISKAYMRDFVLAVRSQLEPVDGASRVAVMITGIDPLIYRPDADSVQEDDARPPFVARLNFDRERISQELPFPIVLWLEKEAFSLLLREAPDLTHWISARFDFGGFAPFALQFFQSLLATNRLPGETPSINASDEDSLLRELEKVPKNGDRTQTAKRITLLSLLVQRYISSSEDSKARKSAREVLRLMKQSASKESEAQVHLALGFLQRLSGKPKLEIKEFEEALRCANQTRNTGLASRALLELGKAHAKKSPPIALDYLEQARQAAASAGDKVTLLEALTQLGETYRSAGETAKALRSLEEALSIAQEAEDLRQEATALMGIGNLLTKEPAKAVVYYQRCLPILARLGDRRLESLCLLHIGLTYAKLGEFRHAISYLERCLAVAAELRDHSVEAVTLNAIAGVHLLVGDEATAKDYWDRSVSRARASHDPLSEAQLLLGISSTLGASGEKERAIKSAKRALKIFRESKKPSKAKEAQDLINQLEEASESSTESATGSSA